MPRTPYSPVRISLILAFFLGLWMLSGFFKSSREESSTTSVAKTQEVFRVNVLSSQAQEKAIPLVVTGITSPNRTVNISSKTSGVIEKIMIKKGTPVKKGTVIAQIDPKTSELNLKGAKAEAQQQSFNTRIKRKLYERGFSSEAGMLQAEALQAGANAKVEKAHQDLAYTKIIAPFSGIVDKNFVELGTFVQPGNPVFTLLDLDPLLIGVHIPEHFVRDVKIHSTAQVEIGGQTVLGKVTYKGASSNQQTRTFPVELSLSNPNPSIPAGLTAKVTLEVGKSKIHQVPPHVLTLKTDGSLAAKHVGADNKVIETPVTIVFSEEEKLWITGLPDMVKLITHGQDYVNQGQVVDPVPVSQEEKA